jgi:hypothetical protein
MISRSGILERVIGATRGDLSPDLARLVLSLDFPATDHARYSDLAARAQEDALTDEEKAELDDYLSVNDFLIILQAKARASLSRHTPAA